MHFHHLLLLGLSTFLHGASSSPLLPRSNSGQATYYGGNLAGGNCMFSTYTLPSGIYGTASANWDNSAHCGACVSVKGPDGTRITAMVSPTLDEPLLSSMLWPQNHTY